MSNLNKLIRIANLLDIKGLYAEADLVDEILVYASITSVRSNLIKALKNDDREESMSALTSLVRQVSNPANALGMDSKDFKEFANAIKDGHLDAARKLFGVGQDVKLDPSTHNPVTQQPWSSGPVTVKPTQRGLPNLTQKEKDIVKGVVGDSALSLLLYGDFYDLFILVNNFTIANNMAIDERLVFLTKIRDAAAIMYPNRFNDIDFPDF